jgi:flagellar hook-length control protein FliK
MKLLETATTTNLPMRLFSEERSAQRQQGFDMVFANAERRQSADINSTRQSDGRTNRASQADNTNRRRNERQSSEPERPDRQQEAVIAEAPPPVEQPPTEVDNAISEDRDEDIISSIAEILQVPVETVMAWLDQLDLLPQDLKDPQAVAQLLRTVFDVHTPAELLTEPAFPEAYKAINEAIQALMLEEAQSTEMMFVVADSAKATATQLPLVEGLQVTMENNQVIVSEGLLHDEVDVEILEQQTQPTRVAASTDAQAQTNDNPLLSQEDAKEALLPPTQKEQQVVEQPIMGADQLTNMIAARKVEQAVQTALPTSNVNATDIINQIMDRVKVHAGEQFTEMRLTLKPENLGDIVLRVLTQNGIVTAQFEAESQRVRETLEANFNLLRDALEEQGIRFGELSVSVRQDENERMNQFEQGRQSSRRRMESINNVALEEESNVLDPSTLLTGALDVIA